MKKGIFIVVILMSLFTINNLLHSIYELWQKQDVLVRAQHELTAEKKENSKLKSAYQKVQDQAFIEAEARDKLLLSKANENVILLEKKPVPVTRTPSPQPLAPWQQWWQIFVK